MKYWILAAICVLGLAGCAHEYVVSTTDGRMLRSVGKPELDDDTGMIEFTDKDGHRQQIPKAQIKQVTER